VKRLFAGALLASVVAACSESTIAPTQSMRRVDATSAASEAGRYLVYFNGSSVDAGFAAQVAALGGSMDASYDGIGMAIVSGLSESAAATLATSPGVTSVDEDAVYRHVGDTPVVMADATDIGVASVANPAGAGGFALQWNMRQIEAPAAWAAGQLGSASVKVAILDTGMDYDNLDLNGLVDLANSASFVPSDDALVALNFPGRNPVTDLNIHGTNVASIVSSKAVVFAGVTSKTTLMAVKVLDKNGNGANSAILSGVVYAVEHGANVINMSLGNPALFSSKPKAIKDFEKLTDRFFQYAKSRGVLVVVAAGNEAQDMDTKQSQKFFCNSVHVSCVSATGPTNQGSIAGPFTNPDAPATYSNYGGNVSVSAPGGNLNAPPAANTAVWSLCSRTTLLPGFGACRTSLIIIGAIGTSQAAPHVTGLAASLLGQRGSMTPGALQSIIEGSSDDLGPKGKDPRYGRGRINVKTALGL
jgi:hypothetical protein